VIRPLTALLVEALDLAFGRDEPDRPPFRPEADAEDLPALADIEAEEDEADLVGFVEPAFSFDFDEATGLRLAPAGRESAVAWPFAADDEGLVEDRALEDEPPAAVERVAALFFVVGVWVSVAELVSERWGWNR
jgi:hypothetical protein